jgi:hypothetical protein
MVLVEVLVVRLDVFAVDMVDMVVVYLVEDKWLGMAVLLFVDIHRMVVVYNSFILK